MQDALQHDVMNYVSTATTHPATPYQVNFLQTQFVIRDGNQFETFKSTQICNLF